MLNRKGKLDAQCEHKAQLKTWTTQHHLSERDVSVIRIVMSEASQQIRQFEKLRSKSSSLKKSGKITTALKSSRMLYKGLMDHPRDIIDYPDFFYKDLPHFITVMENFITLEQSKINTQDVKNTLAQTLETLKNLADQLTDHFEYYAEEVRKDSQFDTQSRLTDTQNLYFDTGYKRIFDPFFNYIPKYQPKFLQTKYLVTLAIILALVTKGMTKFPNILNTSDSTNSLLNKDYYDSYKENTLLQELGLKRKQAIEKPSLINFELNEEGHHLSLSNGYQITWSKTLYVSEKKDFSQVFIQLLPNLEGIPGYGYADRILTLTETGNNASSFPQQFELAKYDNIITDLKCSSYANDIQHIFPLAPIDDIETGYIVTFQASPSTLDDKHALNDPTLYAINIVRYFVFPDGSGLSIESDYYPSSFTVSYQTDSEKFKELKTSGKIDDVKKCLANKLPDDLFTLSKT